MRAFRFGAFVLEPQERRLSTDGGAAIDLTPKAFDTLVYLVEHQGRLVSKDELMQAIWADTVVEDGNLPRMIHVLRRALGQDGTGPQFIETIPTRGYRFVGTVTDVNSAPLIEPAPPDVPVHTGTTRKPASTGRLLGVAAVLLIAVVAAGLVWSALGRGVHSAGDRVRLQTSSGAAYAEFKAGRLYMERHYPGDYELALQNFEAAIALDPQFAEAYAGKADARIYMYVESGSHDDITQARQAMEKAISLDAGNSYAYTMLCRIRAAYDWDFRGAESACRHAVDLDPDSHEARREHAFLLNSLGHVDEAMAEMDAAIALAPTSYNKRSRGMLLYHSRRYDEAIEQLKQVQASDPEFQQISQWIARSYEQKGDYPQALEFFIRSRTPGDGSAPGPDVTFRAAFESGGWPAVLKASLSGARPNLETAGTLAQLGESDQAFEVLNQMISARRVRIVQMDSDPRLDSLRSDPRYEQVARRVGLR